MKNGINAKHWNDSDGNPAGGNTFGVGFAIGWQNGPLGRGAGRVPANGAFVEDIIDAALNRLEYYQQSKFACSENADAMEHLECALRLLASRTAKREAAGVEGTHAK